MLFLKVCHIFVTFRSNHYLISAFCCYFVNSLVAIAVIVFVVVIGVELD